MKSKIIDYHGFTVEEALRDFEKIVWSLEAIDGLNLQVITGYGKIRDAIINFLNKYSIKWHYLLGNKGCLIVIINENENYVI